MYSYMELKGKKLLLIGGGAYADDIRKYKIEKEFQVYTIGDFEDKRVMDFTDKFFQINRKDVERISQMVIEEGVHGIFCGSSEEFISVAIDVAEKTNANFYVTREQWDLVSNKARFKEIARKYGFPVIPEFNLSASVSEKDLDALEFPVMIKPTDSSGARGMNPCYSKKDFIRLYEYAQSHSKCKEVIVEKLITNAKEVFVNYTIQNGVATLSYAFTKFRVETNDKNILVPLFHIYPCQNIEEYYEKVDERAKHMINGLGLKNGTLTLQGFYKDGEFCFFEAGFRMGGAQAYILTDYNWGANSLKYMINYALTGSMSDDDISLIENARFRYPSCNYYVVLNSGRIEKIEGIDKIKELPYVLNVTQMCNVGDDIHNTNALDRIGFRIHVSSNSMEDLARNLVLISSTLKIYSDKGEDMQMEHLQYERCLTAIMNK